MREMNSSAVIKRKVSARVIEEIGVSGAPNKTTVVIALCHLVRSSMSEIARLVCAAYFKSDRVATCSHEVSS